MLKTKLIANVVMLSFLLVPPTYAVIKIEVADDVEVKRPPLEIICQGETDAPEDAHVLYNCYVTKFKNGDVPNPSDCQPAMPGVPPFKLGGIVARCPIDGTFGSAHPPPSDWKNRKDGEFGILGKDMVVFTNKGWMPCEPKNFEKKWKC